MQWSANNLNQVQLDIAAYEDCSLIISFSLFTQIGAIDKKITNVGENLEQPQKKLQKYSFS